MWQDMVLAAVALCRLARTLRDKVYEPDYEYLVANIKPHANILYSDADFRVLSRRRCSGRYGEMKNPPCDVWDVKLDAWRRHDQCWQQLKPATGATRWEALESLEG